MGRTIDLHTHTTASDGTDTPSELVRLAVAVDLAAVAVTDHDTVAGLDEAEEAGRTFGMEVIRGCELSVRTPFGELHLLGLWLPHEIQPLQTAFETAWAWRSDRNVEIVAKLNSANVPLTYEQVVAESGGQVVGRPHIARALVRHGYVPNEQAAFERWLRSGAPAYVPRKALSAPEGVRLLADTGATVAVAHPLLARCPRPELEAYLAGLRASGLMALEAYHAEFSQADEQYVRALTKRLGLGITGGSDYHGASKPSVKLGRGRGGMRVSTDVLDALKQQRQTMGLTI